MDLVTGGGGILNGLGKQQMASEVDGFGYICIQYFECPRKATDLALNDILNGLGSRRKQSVKNGYFNCGGGEDTSKPTASKQRRMND